MIDRRDFMKAATIAALSSSVPALSGCARLLTWSESQHETPEPRRVGTAPSATATGTTETSATGTAPTTLPDIGVLQGDDPAANALQAVALIGGMGRFVSKGDDVVVKPNILTAKEPKYGATTNPAVVAAIVKMCWEAGAGSVTVLDNPTAPPRQAYQVAGIAAAVDAVDGRMKVLTGRDFDLIDVPEGRALTEWPMVTDVFDADVFINVPCAKTHGLAGLTLSMKNLMGILGGSRGRIHQDFDQKIVDLNGLVRPHLTVLDGTRLLVRNGPSGGSLADVRPGNTVAAGTNQVSMDSYGATLFGRTASQLSYVMLGAEQGLGEPDLSKLTIEERRA